MRMIFADTSYWVALIDARDQWHEKSTAVSKSLGNLLVVTTDEVLTEVLAFFSAYSSKTRQRVLRFVLDLMNNSTDVDVVEQSRAFFWRAWRSTNSGPTRVTASLIVSRCNS